MGTQTTGTPINTLRVDPVQAGLCVDAPSCRRMIDNVRKRLVGRFIAENEPTDDQIVVAAIDLRDLSYEDYIASVKKRYKGNVVRDARKSDKAGFICRPFPRALFLPDIVEINHSKDERCGKPMREAYLKSLEEMGGPPRKHVELESPDCPVHYDRWWGIFAPEEGYQQGEVTTNEKLLAYIDFRRLGDLAIYSLILGHGDYLKHGVMYRLHFAIMEWLCARESDLTRGVTALMYAGFYQGGHGLQLWKKKTCFEPVMLQLDEPLPTPDATAFASGQGILGRLKRMISRST